MLTGDIKPKQRVKKTHQGKITNWEKFTASAQEHGDKTQTEMA